MVKTDLIIYNIGELVFFKEPIRKINDENTKILKNMGIAIKEGKILDIGESNDIRNKYEGNVIINAHGNLVTSGLIDMHTHMVFAGSREDELDKKLSGISYSQILKEGGGIYKTVKMTRSANFDYLKNKLENLLKKSLYLGTTTLEIKSGYGLDLDNELKILKVIDSIKNKFDVIPTLLAHVIPKEFNNGDDYVNYFNSIIIPEVSRQKLAKYVDVFCDENAFNVNQTRKILKEALKYGFRLRIHADQLKYIGCSDLVKEFSFDSIDHLESCPKENLSLLSRLDSSLGLLPASIMSMMDFKKPLIDEIKRKALISLGTDYSANSPMLSMQNVIDLSIYYLNFRPIEALAYSTINSAYSLRLNDVGNIDKGKKADILIWDLENINQLGYYWGYDRLLYVIKNGMVIRGE